MDEGILADDLLNDADDSNLADDVLGGGDFIEDVHGLKGLISKALGGLVFKAAILVVILYNFVYTFYTAFEYSATEETTMIYNNCSCQSKDRMFYTIFTVSTIVLWLLFFFIHELYRLYRFTAKQRKEMAHNGDRNLHQTSRETEETWTGEEPEDAENKMDFEDIHRQFLSQELQKFAFHVCRLSNQNLHGTEVRNGISDGIQHFLADCDLEVSQKSSICDYITDMIKCFLIFLQFVVRFPVVPLLLLQWLDEYSWKCVFGQFKDYCSSGAKGYYVDQSLVVYGFYMCILLAIVIATTISLLPTTLSPIPQHHSQIKYYSKWFLLFRVPRSIFFPNFDFVIVFTLIYTSVLAQLSFSAVSETEVDITSGRLFNINNNWSHVSIRGGVSNSVLWQCTEQSNSYFFKVVFAIALIIPSLLMFFAIWNPLIVWLRYRQVRTLLSDHNIHTLATNFQEIFNLRKLNNLSARRISQMITGSLNDNNRSEMGQSYRWYVVFFMLPLLEHALIFLLVAVILTSYNLNPLGCFFHTANYDFMTETVLLKASKAVYIYQEVAVSFAFVICVVWIACKAFQIHFTPSSTNTNFNLINVIMNAIEIQVLR